MTTVQLTELTQQILNMPVLRPEVAGRIRHAVNHRGRQEVKNDLLKAGQTEQDIEFTFAQAGV